MSKTPKSFRWTPEMLAIWPPENRPTMSNLLAIWDAMQDAAEYDSLVPGEVAKEVVIPEEAQQAYYEIAEVMPYGTIRIRRDYANGNGQIQF